MKVRESSRRLPCRPNRSHGPIRPPPWRTLPCPRTSRSSTTPCPPPPCTSAPGPTRCSTSRHDPLSLRRQVWLGILGPSATWLLRRLADGLDARPDGYDLALEDTARSLGLGTRALGLPVRAGARPPCQFRLAQIMATRASRCGSSSVALPPPARAAATRPARRPSLLGGTGPPDADAELRRRRARELALSLLDLGEDTADVERLLHRWRIHPAMAHEALRWAVTHRTAHGIGTHAPPGETTEAPVTPTGADDRWDPLGASEALPPLPLPRTPPPGPRSRQDHSPDAA